jgi:hypothetical protein
MQHGCNMLRKAQAMAFSASAMIGDAAYLGLYPGSFFFGCCSHATACHGSERIGFVLRVGLSPQADELTLP